MYRAYMKNYMDPAGDIITDWKEFLSVPFSEGPGRNGIIKPTVKNEMGKADSFDFDIETISTVYDAFLIMKTLIRVEYDGDLIFYGRVLDVKDTLWGTRSIACEGALAFLLDVQFPGKQDDDRTKRSLNTYLNELINYYKTYADSDHDISLGYIPGTYADANTNSEQRVSEDTAKHGSSSWNSISGCLDEIKGKYGGFFRIRYTSNGLYLDWLRQYFNKTENSQVLDFQSNIVNVSSAVEVSDIFTAVIPIGTHYTTSSAKTKKDNSLFLTGYNGRTTNYIRVDELKNIFSAEQLNWGYHTKADYDNAVNKYGLIFKTVQFQYAYTQSDLWAYATDWIRQNYIGELRTFTITALDLHTIHPSIEKIMVGDRIYIYQPGDFEKTSRSYTCISISHDLYNPEANSYSIGVPEDKPTKDYGFKKDTKHGGKSSNSSKTKNDNRDAEESEKREEDAKYFISSFANNVGAIFGRFFGDSTGDKLNRFLRNADDSPNVYGWTVYSLLGIKNKLLLDMDTGVIQGIKGWWTDHTVNTFPGFPQDWDFNLLNLQNSNGSKQLSLVTNPESWKAQSGTLSHDGSSSSYSSFGVAIDGPNGIVAAKKFVYLDGDEPVELNSKLIVIGTSLDQMDVEQRTMLLQLKDMGVTVTSIMSDVTQIGTGLTQAQFDIAANKQSIFAVNTDISNINSSLVVIGGDIDAHDLELREQYESITTIKSELTTVNRLLAKTITTDDLAAEIADIVGLRVKGLSSSGIIYASNFVFSGDEGASLKQAFYNAQYYSPTNNGHPYIEFTKFNGGTSKVYLNDIPSNYIVSASVSQDGKTLTLTPASGTPINFNKAASDGSYNDGWEAARLVSSSPTSNQNGSSFSVSIPSATVGSATSLSYYVTSTKNEARVFYSAGNDNNVLISSYSHNQYNAGWNAAWSSVSVPSSQGSGATMTISVPNHTVDGSTVTKTYQVTSTLNDAYIYDVTNSGSEFVVATVNHNQYNQGKSDVKLTSTGWVYDDSTLGSTLTVTKGTTGSNSYSTTVTATADISYNSSTHKYTAFGYAKSGGSTIASNSSVGGLEAYNDGWTAARNKVTIPGVIVNGNSQQNSSYNTSFVVKYPNIAPTSATNPLERTYTLVKASNTVDGVAHTHVVRLEVNDICVARISTQSQYEEGWDDARDKITLPAILPSNTTGLSNLSDTITVKYPNVNSDSATNPLTRTYNLVIDVSNKLALLKYNNTTVVAMIDASDLYNAGLDAGEAHSHSIVLRCTSATAQSGQVTYTYTCTVSAATSVPAGQGSTARVYW